MDTLFPDAIPSGVVFVLTGFTCDDIDNLWSRLSDIEDIRRVVSLAYQPHDGSWIMTAEMDCNTRAIDAVRRKIKQI